MSKSYRWQPDRWAERLAYKRGEDNWRKEVEEEMSYGTTTVYVVRNFWTPTGEDFELSEDVHATFSEQGAWDVLYSLAEGQGVSLGVNEYSFESTKLDQHTAREYYAITSMEVND